MGDYSSLGQDTLVFFCNGKKITDAAVDPSLTLANYLRSRLNLRGSKIGCAEGGCGACTVMVSSVDAVTGDTCHMAVNSCLTPVCSVHGMAVTTVEGIGTTAKLHPVQERIAKAHGSQCGFCTPGFVMSMYTLIRNNPKPTMEEIHEALEGNLCRCTGYRPIIEGFRSFSEGCCGNNKGNGCCKDTSTKLQNGGNMVMSTKLFRPQDFIPYDPSQDFIFPPELMLQTRIQNERDYVLFKSDRIKWFQPLTMETLLQLKVKNPAAKLVMGNTEIGVEVKFKNQHYPVIINTRHIPELNEIKRMESGVYVGSAVTLTKLSRFLKGLIQQEPTNTTRSFEAFVEMLKWFAGIQIRNVASIGGNIVTASPISDLNPLLMAAGASLDVSSIKGARKIKLDESFFVGYRKIALESNEILVGVHIPFTRKDEYFYGFKQAQRKEDDISIVNAGMMVEFEEDSNKVKEIRLSFGGMAATTVMAKKTMAELKGRIWNQKMMNLAIETLLEDLPLTPGAPGGMEAYRQSLALGFFFKFFMKVSTDLRYKKISPDAVPLPEHWKSATSELTSKPFKSTQLFQEVSESQDEYDPVGRPQMVLSALQQATGEAMYNDDLPRIEGELFLALVYSTNAHANIRSIDFEPALSVDGVYDVVSAKDVPGENKFHVIISDETLFADEKVNCVGQVVAGVLAKDPAVAQRAAKLVKIDYDELEPIFTIKEAIDRNSYFCEPSVYSKGDVELAFKQCDHILEDEMATGAQEHFYMEPQVCLVIPKGEHGEIEMISSTQDVAHNQFAAAEALGIPSNRIVCKTKRLGGAFGGKESRSCFYGALAAVAAVKTGRPVRLNLDRDEDMISSGTRHPFLAKYKIGFSKEGKIMAADITYYANGGHCTDFTPAVVNVALINCDSCYKIPNIRVTGICCKTNLPSCTAFRGFGAPQGLVITENWITDIAKICGKSQKMIREMNFYSEGDLTHINQPLIGFNLPKCWDYCLLQSDFDTRRQDVDQFNRENRWKKRGLAITPTKQGVGFSGVQERFLNQAGALVNVYKDGAVILTHGGVEMGQGLYTKMIQVASHSLGIPTNKIFTSEVSSDKIPNTSPTAGSSGSDLNGMAVKDACEKIMRRLNPFIEKNPSGSWEEWVMEAYKSRISLSASGFYSTPGLDYDREKNWGRSFNYFCYGAAVSEVEIDCLTGDHVVLRTDIVMDVGKSINPAIDIGQIEGAFAQGYGLFMLEDYRFTSHGHLLTKGPGAYKIPSIGNTPAEFNVTLLENSSNPRAIHSSKAVGEPPLFMSASVLFAVKDAITAARADANLPIVFRLDVPAVPERIRMACQDHLTDKIKSPHPTSFTPFFIRP